MRPFLLSLSVCFAFGAMCTGAVSSGPDELVDEDPVVVPVDGDKDDEDEDEDDEDWCCEYKDDAGATQYALVDGPSDCNDQFGTKEGRYISGNQCIPCCCETPKDPQDLAKGHVYELTTPKSCNSVSGECKEAGHEECADDREDVDGDKDRDRDHDDPARPHNPAPRGPRVIERPDGRR